METKFANLWKDKYPNEKLPNIFNGRQNLQTLLNVYEGQILELRKTLQQVEFIQQFIQNVLKTRNHTPGGNAPKTRPRSVTLDRFNNNNTDPALQYCDGKTCKDAVSRDKDDIIGTGSLRYNSLAKVRPNLKVFDLINKEHANNINSCVQKTVASVYGVSTTHGRAYNSIGRCANMYRDKREAKPLHSDTKSTTTNTGKTGDACTNDKYRLHSTGDIDRNHLYSRQPIIRSVVIPGRSNKGSMINDRCAGSVDVAQADQVYANTLPTRTKDHECDEPRRPVIRSRLSRPFPINRLKNMSRVNSEMSIDVDGTSDALSGIVSSRSNLFNSYDDQGSLKSTGLVRNSSIDKPVPIPRTKKKSRSLNEPRTTPVVMTIESDTSINANIKDTTDIGSIESDQSQSVHSRINNLEQKLHDVSLDSHRKSNEMASPIEESCHEEDNEINSFFVKYLCDANDKNERYNKTNSDPIEEKLVGIEKTSVERTMSDGKCTGKPAVKPRYDYMNVTITSMDDRDKETKNVTIQDTKPQKRAFSRSERGIEETNSDSDKPVEKDCEVRKQNNASSLYENVTISVVNDVMKIHIYKPVEDECADSQNISDNSDYSSNSLERPKRHSYNSEDEVSSLDEYDGVPLNFTLTENQASLELVSHDKNSTDFTFDETTYDKALSFYFDEHIDVVDEHIDVVDEHIDVVDETPRSLIETDIDSEHVNLTDDHTTDTLKPQHTGTTCDDDEDSGLSLDRSLSHIDTSDQSNQELVGTAIDEPVLDEKHNIGNSTEECRLVKIAAVNDRDVKVAIISDDRCEAAETETIVDVNGPPELPKKSRSYQFPRRPRHDYEEIRDFMCPILDVPQEPTVCHELSTPKSLPLITDGKQRQKKRTAPKVTPMIKLPEKHLSVEGADSTDSDETETAIKSPMSPEDKKLHQRFVVIKGILESEKDYVACLTVILQYMRSLEGASKSTLSNRTSGMNQSTPIPFISGEDVKIIFFNIDKIHQIHENFVRDLQGRVNAWHPMQVVGDLFKILISRFPTFTEYIKHYQSSIDCIHRCSNDNAAFRDLVSSIPIPNSKEMLSLIDILFKPVHRIQRNTLVLHDLIKCTPPKHPDHNQLEKTLHLSRHSLGEFGTSLQSTAGNEHERRLVRNGFAVELVGGTRKLRFIFLFSDVFVCTKRKLNARHKTSFEVKWFMPLNQMSVERHIDPDESKPGSVNVEELKKKVSRMKVEIRREMKYDQDKAPQKRWLNPGQKVIDKLKKKLEEQEAELVLASPNLPFKLSHKDKDHKGFTLLMSSDYEREEWSEAINQQKRRWSSDKPPTAIEIHKSIEGVKQLPKVSNIGSVLLKIGSDDDVWNGALNVTINKLTGIHEPADTYVSLDLDSFGHFFMKAKTKVCHMMTQPEWDEEFELDLDGSQTLRVMCYKVGRNGSSDVVLGRSALELNKSWLTERFQVINISMNEIALTISIKHTSVAKTMNRKPSHLKNGVFGVRISNVCRREHRDIPIIVTSCAEEIERRGLDELGIYRVSGVMSDVQKLKRSFEKNSRSAAANLDQYDIHAITGTLKLYFRELPEPLFTEEQYPHFTTTLELKDTEAKERCMISLLHELPRANIASIIYLLHHLAKVSQSEKVHKMNCSNLSTIFGPTLLHPGTKEVDTTQTVAEQVMASAQEAFMQTAVLLYFLKFVADGKDLSQTV